MMTPSCPLPEMTLPAPALRFSITLSPPCMFRPLAPFVSAVVPAAFRPMMFPWTTSDPPDGSM